MTSGVFIRRMFFTNVCRPFELEFQFKPEVQAKCIEKKNLTTDPGEMMSTTHLNIINHKGI